MNIYQAALGGLIIVCYLHQFGWGAPHQKENARPYDLEKLAKLLSSSQSTVNIRDRRSSALMQAFQTTRNEIFLDYLTNLTTLRHLLLNYCFDVSSRIYTCEYVGNNGSYTLG